MENFRNRHSADQPALAFFSGHFFTRKATLATFFLLALILVGAKPLQNPTIVGVLTDEISFLPGAPNVYPNPADTYLIIAAPQGETISQISCTDLNADLVPVEHPGSATGLEFDVSALEAGTYYFRIQTSAGEETKQVVIQ
jgi:hypothetical protein